MYAKCVLHRCRDRCTRNRGAYKALTGHSARRMKELEEIGLTAAGNLSEGRVSIRFSGGTTPRLRTGSNENEGSKRRMTRWKT